MAPVILLGLALLLLWAQLLASGELQPLVAIAIPTLLVISYNGQWSIRRSQLRLVSLGLVSSWFATTPLTDRGTWLVSLANLLWLMAALKLLEASGIGDKRRAALVLIVGLGLAGVLNQTLAASLTYATSALLVTAALVGLEAGPQPLGGLIRRSCVLIAVLLPVVMVAFLLLPRLPALWSLPGNTVGKSGLGEELRPGELASLVQSGGLAARVELPGGLPAPGNRYWRVLIHQQFDGTSWRGGGVPPAKLQQQVVATGKVIQRWLVEPSRLPWLPWSGKGLPNSEDNLKTTGEGGLWSVIGVGERQLYEIQDASVENGWRQVPPVAMDLEFPQGSNPKLEALGQSWEQKGNSPVQRLALAREWFLTQDFQYSLEPGRLPIEAPLDMFLFKKQVGFCEHYAASFSALMRAANVPARVVVGYLGGRWQVPLGGTPYLQLDQSDAHAWSEVWLDEKGWVQVDPTSWIAPERIQQSLGASLNGSDRRRLVSTSQPRWLGFLVDQWQGLDTRWQLWVMQFDHTSQAELLPEWLEGKWQALFAVMGIAISLATALAVVLRMSTAQSRQDALRQELERCLLALARIGLRPVAGETLQQFCLRGKGQKPAVGDLLTELAKSYDEARFRPGNHLDSSALKRIRKKLWHFYHKQIA